MTPTQKIIFRHKYQSTLFNDSYKIPELSVAGTNRSVIMAVSAPGDINNKCIIINVGSSVPQLPVYSGSKLQTNMLMLHYGLILKRLGLFGMAPNNLGPQHRRGYVLYDTLVDCISVSADNYDYATQAWDHRGVFWCIITIIEKNLLLMLMRYYFQLRSHFL